MTAKLGPLGVESALAFFTQYWVLIRVGLVILTLGGLAWAASSLRLIYKKPFIISAIVVSILPVIGSLLIILVDLKSNNAVQRSHIAGLSLLGISPFFSGLFFVFLFRYFCKKQSIEANNKGNFETFAIFGPLILASIQLILLFSLLLEGIICLIMAAPFWIGFTILGSVTGWVLIWFVNKITGRMLFSSTILVFTPLLLQPLETHYFRQVSEGQVTSVVEINATPDRVFDLVVAFPKIPHTFSPSGWGDSWFALGLPQPVQATVECRAVNCLRKCHFTQNTVFNERITRYEPGRDFSFDVEAQVGPQNLITGVDPHVMPGGIYFETSQGRFELQPTPNGHTILRGTSWYRLHSSINWYAKPWAETFLHIIHNRVLQHVKLLSEETSSPRKA
jgi:hypothetical protein